MTLGTSIWKRAAISAVCAVSIAALAACGQKPAEPSNGATPVATAPNTTGQPAGTGDKGGTADAKKVQSAADVLSKTLETSAKLDSVSVSMDTKQTIDQGGQKMDIQSAIVMDIVMKPAVSFKQSVTTNMAGQDVRMETYMTKDGFFMKEPTSGQWMKLPAEQMDQLLSAMSGEQLDPSKQLEKLKPFANDFTMTEDGDAYIVKLAANGDKFAGFIQSEIAANMGNEPELGEVLKQSMSGLNIRKAEYAFAIDKKTFYPKSITVDMDLDMDMQGQTMKLVQHVQGTYTGYNNVKEIIVPQEALNAQPIGAAAH